MKVSMRRRTISMLIPVVALVGFSASYIGYVRADTFNPYQYALGHLSRAESAQTPSEVIEHVIAAKTELSKVGHVSWWSTDKETFDSIQMQLGSIVARAENISSLTPGNELFNSEISDIHAQLKTIQDSLLAF
ncbi:MAG: hypothetical protein HRF40_11110 [Nitrososphaera sp.]